jgi:DNA-binding protein HU-beta
MNKKQLIAAMAEQADVSQATAGRTLDALVDSITKSLKEGDSVLIVGFGKFSVKKRAARIGRNPRSGEPVNISAANVPKFSAGKILKDALN